MPAKVFAQIEKRKLLAGEGRDETEFFDALLKHLEVTDVQVVDYGGKRKMKDFLAALPRIPGFAELQSLGITRDADDNPDGARQSIDDAIANAKFPQPLQV